MLNYLKNKNIQLRKESPQDKTFLEELYADTRKEELAQAHINEEVKKMFIKSQFELQLAHYYRSFPNGSFQLILFKKKKIGRIYINESSEEIRLVDISILSNYRGRGIGSDFIKALKKLAQNKGIPLTLHVLPFKPAYSLYKHNGFEDISKNGEHIFMKYNPVKV